LFVTFLSRFEPQYKLDKQDDDKKQEATLHFAWLTKKECYQRSTGLLLLHVI
jgi:hypothetical protein